MTLTLMDVDTPRPSRPAPRQPRAFHEPGSAVAADALVGLEGELDRLGLAITYCDQLFGHAVLLVPSLDCCRGRRKPVALARRKC